MKVVKLNTLVDLTKVGQNFLEKEPKPEIQKAHQEEVERWANNPSPAKGDRPKLEKEYMTATEFFRDIAGQAIRQVHKAGTVDVLRRTNKIINEFDITAANADKAGIVTLELDDFKYLRNSFKKADDWKNTPEIAKAILAVDEMFEKAEEVDLS